MNNFVEESKIKYIDPNINIHYCGEIKRAINYTYGPQTHKHFYVLLVEEGEATMHYYDRKIRLSPSHIFVGYPNEPVFYNAETPWTAKYIALSGKSLEVMFNKFGSNRRGSLIVLHNFVKISNIFSEIIEESKSDTNYSRFKIQELVFSLFAALDENTNRRVLPDPVQVALDIIGYEYNKNFEMTRFAKMFRLDTAYFTRLFKKKTGLSPKQYILKLRMEKAKEYLESSIFSIREISTAVGYNDPLYFSSVFKKYFLISPTEYRKAQKNNKTTKS